MKAIVPEKDPSITFRIRGEKETTKDRIRRKKGLEKVAKKLDCSEAQVIRTGIDLMILQTLR